MNKFTADFETSTPKWLEIDNETREEYKRADFAITLYDAVMRPFKVSPIP